MTTLVAGSISMGVAAPASALTPGIEFSADSLATWQTNNVVRAVASAGGKVVAVGNFSQIRPGAGQSGSARDLAALAIFDADTGQPSTCQLPAALSGGTPALYTAEASPDGKTVFVGGNFNSIGGVGRTRVAEINPTTCAVTSFNAGSVSSFVYSLEVTDSSVYIGGMFQTVAGQARQGFAKLSRTGALDPDWVANAVGSMETRPEPGIECRTTADAVTQGRAIQVSPDGSKVALGGSFYSVNGVNTHSIAVVDSSTGSVVRAYQSDPGNWGSGSNFIHPCSFTKAIVSDGTNFYIGNEGSGGGVFDGTAAISWSSLNQVWRDTCLGAVQALLVQNGTLYQAHHHHDCSSIGQFPDGQRIYLSATRTDDPKQMQLGWNPTLNDGTGEGIGGRGLAVATVGSAKYLWVAGEFTRVNGVAQQGLTRFSTVDTGNPPTPSINVRAVTSGAIQIAARSVVDPDDGPLQYILYRNNVQLGQPITATSNWYIRPQVTFVDSTAVPGVSYSYRIRAVDAAGNQSALSAAQNGVATANGSAYAAAVIGDNPALYWRYDDSGAWVIDRSGQTGAGKNGIAQNGVTYSGGAIPGDASSAANFDGTNQYVWNDQIAAGPSTYSIETWFKTASTTGGVLVNYGSGRPRTGTGDDVLSSNYDRMVYMEGDTGRIRFGIYDGGVRTLRTDRAYNDDTWHHLVATQGSGGMRLYVDGVEVGRNNVTTNQAYNGTWHVGGDNLNGWPSNGGNSTAAQFYDGQLDETAIYSTVISQAQAIAHYRAGGGQVVTNDAPADAYGAAVYGDNPTSYWRFDEASGSVAEDSSFLGTRDGVVGSAVVRSASGGQIPGGAVTTPGSNSSGSGVVSTAQVAAPSEYSLEFWLKTTTTSGGKIIGFENTPTDTGSSYDKHVYMTNDGRLRFGVYIGSTATVVSTQRVNDGSWHHVVATQDASGMKLYVDGALSAQNGTPNSETGDGYWRIGGGNVGGWPDQPSSNYFAGALDEVAIYPTALTAASVQNHRALGINDTVAPTVPGALTQTATDAAALSWTASTDATGVVGYRIYKGTTAMFDANAASLAGDVATTSWTDPNAGPGEYYYRVAAYDAAGNESAASGALKVTVADVTAPSAVTGLAATAAGVDVQLDWTAATDNVGVDRYRVYRGASSDFTVGSSTLIAETTTPGYLDAGRDEGHWYYRVVAVDAAGNAGPTTAVVDAIVDIDTDAPSVPADVTAVAGSSGVVVAWAAASDDVGVVGYRVYRGDDAGFTPGAANLVADAVTTLSWTDAAAGVGTHYYKVRAYDAAGNQSDPSDAASAVVADSEAPSVPSGVGASVSGSDVTVSWSASTDNVGVTGYRVYRGSDSGFTPGAGNLIGSPSGLSFKDEGRPVGQWFYRVVAVDAAGNASAASGAVSGTVAAPGDSEAPSVPSGVGASVSGSDVTVSWSASTDNVGVTGYRVYRGSDSGFTPGAGNLIGSPSGLSFKDEGRPVGQWFYRVVAVDAAGNASAASGAVSGTVTAPAVPVTVNVPVTADAMVAQVAPTTLYGLTNQLSARGNTPIESYLRVVLPSAPAGTTLTGAVLQVRTSTDPTAGSTATHSINLLTGSWDEAAVNWNNRPTTAGALLGTLGAAPAVNTAYTATLDPSKLTSALGSTQTLRLSSAAAVTDNVRLWSREASTAGYRPVLVLTFTPTSGTPADSEAPSVPSGVGASVSGSDVTVSWSASTDNVGVTGYRVYRGSDSGFTPGAGNLIGSPSGLSFTDEGRPVGQWFYRVVAVDAAGNASAASGAVSGTVAAPGDSEAPSVPSGVGASVSGSDVTVSWSASTDNVGVTGYRVYRGSDSGFTPGAGNLIGSPSGLSFKDEGRPVGQWFYRVVAVDAAGNASAASGAVSGTVTAPAVPVTVNVPVTADAMVAQVAPTTLYGLTNQLSARGNTPIESYLRVVLPSAPAGTTLTGAVLQVRTSTDPTAGSTATHSINLLTGSWDEAAVNWNNRPTTAGALLGTLGAAPAVNTAYTATLDPSKLTSALGSTQTLRLSSAAAVTDNVRLWSREASTAGYRPVLVLTFTPGG